MIRRWIFRGLLILPILLCFAGWADSYGHLTSAGFTMRGDPEFGINMWHGVVDFTYTHGALRGRLWYQRNADATNNRSLLQRGDGVYLGFTWGRWNDTEGGVDLRWVGIPYYFLIMLFAAALAIMWRPRKRINSRQAFPVEPARSGPRDGV